MVSERRGRTYVYVLPSIGEDLVKVGLTHDPFERFRAFHQRFYTHFDLERGLLIETGKLREARRVERLFIERWPEHRAYPPTLVNDAAGGHTEWFRGIESMVPDFASRIVERYGYMLHAPLKAWLREKLAEQADVLYQWAYAVHDSIQQQALYEPELLERRSETMLRDMLDMYAAMDFSLETLVPANVFNWYTAKQG
jgi:T5orf172 domain